MAIFAEETNINARNYVPASSRYADSSVRYYGEEKIIVFETYKRKINPSNYQNIEYAKITESIEYRPDLVSQELYSTPDYWWKIMEFNGMKDILEFKAGKTIKLPSNIF